MNSVVLVGRLTKDPDVRYTASTQVAVARFSLAVDRPGKDRGTDYPDVVCFGKTAELVERYLAKGRLAGVQGRLQTGSYEKDGRKVYTTEVVAERVEFLGKSETPAAGQNTDPRAGKVPGPDPFDDISDIPF